MALLELLQQFLKINVMIKKIFTYSYLILLILIGCQEEPSETPTKGYLKCYVDESLYNVVKDEADLFMNLYPKTKIDLIPVKAREGIAAVLNNESEMFVSSRQLNREEQEFAQKTKSEIKLFKFCYDGIAVISNKKLVEDKINLMDLKNLLTGKSKKYNVIIPEKNSGVYEYITSHILLENQLAGAVIVNSESDVIKKISVTNNSLGLVGLNTLKGITGIKVLKIGTNENNITSVYYEPLAGYLINGSYPLARTTYIFLNEIGIGVASGFTTFLTSSEGQKVVMKNDLGPATVPVKLIQLN